MSGYTRLYSYKVPSDASLGEQALAFAASAHSGQKDWSGVPYIYHPVRVAAMARMYGLDETHEAVALLHDVLEDTSANYLELEHKFGATVAHHVGILTRDPATPYNIYIENILPYSIARRVKLLDLADNLHPHRDLTEKSKSLRQRYMVARRVIVTYMLAHMDTQDVEFLINSKVLLPSSCDNDPNRLYTVNLNANF